jgi:hypothetical protein
MIYHNFTRCVRPDGTAYGTSGRCRKGVDRSEEEQEEQAYEKKEFIKFLRENFKNNLGLWGKYRDRYMKMEELADKARKLDDGKFNIISTHEGVTLKKRISDFNEVSFLFKNFDRSVSFEVNGDYNYGQIEDPRERVRATLAIRDMFRTFTRALKPGTVITCSAFEEDGMGDVREGAYRKIGFSAPDEDQVMRGIVQKGGGVQPYEFSERGKELLYWHLALFGSLPKR